MSNKIGQTTLLSNNPYIELNNQGQIITFQLTQKRHILGRDRHRANLVAHIPHNIIVLQEVTKQYLFNLRIITYGL